MASNENHATKDREFPIHPAAGTAAWGVTAPETPDDLLSRGALLQGTEIWRFMNRGKPILGQGHIERRRRLFLPAAVALRPSSGVTCGGDDLAATFISQVRSDRR